MGQGAGTLLLLCLQQNEINIKQVAALALGDIVRHSVAHAKAICDADGVIYLGKAIDNLDTKLKVTIKFKEFQFKIFFFSTATSSKYFSKYSRTCSRDSGNNYKYRYITKSIISFRS